MAIQAHLWRHQVQELCLSWGRQGVPRGLSRTGALRWRTKRGCVLLTLLPSVDVEGGDCASDGLPALWPLPPLPCPAADSGVTSLQALKEVQIKSWWKHLLQAACFLTLP